MNFLDFQNTVRAATRDFSNSIFRQQDVEYYINEAIDRIRRVPVFQNMVHLSNTTDVPILLPEQYHPIITMYAASRLFMQDERNYQAVTYMNEFENKLEELYDDIQMGKVIIKDSTGTVVTETYTEEVIADEYFPNRFGQIANYVPSLDAPDLDPGVAGLAEEGDIWEDVGDGEDGI